MPLFAFLAGKSQDLKNQNLNLVIWKEDPKTFLSLNLIFNNQNDIQHFETFLRIVSYKRVKNAAYLLVTFKK